MKTDLTVYVIQVKKVEKIFVNILTFCHLQCLIVEKQIPIIASERKINSFSVFAVFLHLNGDENYLDNSLNAYHN